jgi:ATPase family associated with various cellular activities (AAA)
MRTETLTAWAEQNRMCLLREFGVLRRLLGDDEHLEKKTEPEPMERPAAIDALATIFELSQFERELLLVCAGVEMEPTIAERCAEMTGRPRGFVTFGLAMGVLPDPHWSALAPSAPLRRYRLIEIESGHGLTTAPLHIDERILHYLAGVNQMDQRLEALVAAKGGAEQLSEEQRELANEIVATASEELTASAVLHFYGDDADGQENVAASIAHRMGRELFVLHMEDTPAPGADQDQFVALWTREALLLPAYLLLQWGAETPTAAARQLAKRLPAPWLMASRTPLRMHQAMQQYEVNKPSPMGQRQLWEEVLGPAEKSLSAIVDQMAEQFRLSAETIAIVGAAARAAENGDSGQLSRRLWNACSAVSRPQLEMFAERIVPAKGWNDLILPTLQLQMLQQIAAQARNRMTVYERWGFAAVGRRGLGLSVLFCGVSGTGKTLAAEVLAKELHLDLYRIDLSTVVSKYIGDTEKCLRQVFDAAETGGVLLLFDEADAIFGKRAEVKDSHDRYANIEISYLLQRMESFQGLAILTSNMKSALDTAFQRRLRFIVDFPFPDATHRQAIWKGVFPAATPAENLAPALLANLNVAGGSIRNIALNAAFMAAEQGSPVRMQHVLEATQLEAVKVERPLARAEIKGWV